MVVTEDGGTFITGRQAGDLVTVKVRQEDDHTLTLHAQGHDSIKVDIQIAIQHSSRAIESKCV